MNMDNEKIVKCAIYTRKSHELGLELSFNSLDAQRESAENYIASQRENGWVALPEHYDDGGFSGGNMERPALKRLMEDVKAGKIDCIVVYKIDRLSRSLMDFTQLIEELNKYNVNFISVTQHIQTSDSAGRMMLNVLMTFAEFERAILAERILDRVAMAKRRGKYCGGSPVIGYDADIKNKKLVINESEAKIVRHIFERYPELGSAKKLAAELNARGWRTKAWTSQKAQTHGGQQWNTAHIYRILNNPLYTGLVTHHDKTFSGEHEAIVEKKAWDKVHKLFEESCHGQEHKTQATMNTPLRGLIRCGHCGGAMTPTYSRKGKLRYTYYFCQADSKRAVSVCPLKRIPGGDIEKAVIQQLGAVFRMPSLMAETVAEAVGMENSEREKLLEEKENIKLELEKAQSEIIGLASDDSAAQHEKIEALKKLAMGLNKVNEQLTSFEKNSVEEKDVAAMLENIESLWTILFPAEQYRLMRLIVNSVSVREDAINIILKTDEMPSLIAELAEFNMASRPAPATSRSGEKVISPEVLPDGKIMLRIPAFFKYKNGRKMIITPETLDGKNPDSPSMVQSPIVRAIKNAHEWRARLESGEIASIAELARTLGYRHPYVTRILSLTTLAPDIVEAIINGEEPSGLSLEKLVSGFPEDWNEQRKFFKITA